MDLLAAQQEPPAEYFVEDIQLPDLLNICLSAFQIKADADMLSEQFWVLLVAHL